MKLATAKQPADGIETLYVSMKTVLIREQAQLKEEVTQLQADLKSISLAKPDPMDQSSAREEYDSLLRSIEVKLTRLQKISQSLNAIEDGEYGYCTGCGDEIAHERLEANPVATHCFACASAKEYLDKAMAAKRMVAFA